MVYTVGINAVYRLDMVFDEGRLNSSLWFGLFYLRRKNDTCMAIDDVYRQALRSFPAIFGLSLGAVTILYIRRANT